MPQEWSGQIGDELVKNCGRSLIPEPVWCTERQHPAYSPPQLGVRTAAGSMPGMAVAASWFAHPAVPPECPGSLSSQGPLPPASHHLVFGKHLWGLIVFLAVVLCPLTVLTQRIGPPLPSIPPVVTSGVVQDGCPFLPAFSLCPWTLEAC